MQIYIFFGNYAKHIPFFSEFVPSLPARTHLANITEFVFFYEKNNKNNVFPYMDTNVS